MEKQLYQLLARHGLRYQRFEHPAVYTCEEADRLLPDLPGAKTKNLFLCDGKGKRHVLVAVPADASVDIRALGEKLGLKGLRLASAERLKTHLGLEPGAVTLLAAVNDRERQVQVVIDLSIWRQSAILCHPLVNTATLAVPTAELARFFELTGHAPLLLDVPLRA
ncbi:aminoacyl-tRNA deacylase [Xenophilus sp. AP218F]|nr:prolyl-tRNA synthetase associated domain-containing protein [Chromobacterium sp. ASV5]OWY40238.1 aminoacyl-tRNA deacylase [Xenophilus sp. AP218F]